MPPNLLVKAAFVDFEKHDDYKKQEYWKGKTGVRTDFILKNIYSYLLSDRYHFNCIRHMNKKEEDVLKQLKETVNAFQINYASTVKSLCTEIDVSVETVGTVLLGVANELFCEGITWSRIIALFVFVGELTLLCLSKGLPDYTVDLVYECFSRLVTEKLEPWVIDHEGWEGITSLSVVAQENSLKVSNPGWAKSLLYSTVRMLGTVALIANYSNQVVP